MYSEMIEKLQQVLGKEKETLEQFLESSSELIFKLKNGLTHQGLVVDIRNNYVSIIGGLGVLSSLPLDSIQNIVKV